VQTWDGGRIVAGILVQALQAMVRLHAQVRVVRQPRARTGTCSLQRLEGMAQGTRHTGGNMAA